MTTRQITMAVVAAVTSITLAACGSSGGSSNHLPTPRSTTIDPGSSQQYNGLLCAKSEDAVDLPVGSTQATTSAKTSFTLSEQPASGTQKSVTLNVTMPDTDKLSDVIVHSTLLASDVGGTLGPRDDYYFAVNVPASGTGQYQIGSEDRMQYSGDVIRITSLTLCLDRTTPPSPSATNTAS